MSSAAPSPQAPSPWASLLPAALVGANRQASAALPLPGQAGQLSQAIARAASASAAETLLRQAALLAVCQQAQRPPPAAASAPPTPCPPDSRPPVADAAMLAHLRWLLLDKAPPGLSLNAAPARLLHEALQTLGARGWRLPPALLPAALAAGRRNASLRPALLPMLGARGQWLAGQCDDWRYAAPSLPTGQAQTEPQAMEPQAVQPDDPTWQTGTLLQRQQWLADARQRNPAAAREALAQALPDLPAKERTTLLACLAQGLGLGDEALLTQLLGDRSREVRQTAVALLCALPDSAHAQGMGQRLAALVHPKAVAAGLKSGIQAPEAAGSDWKALVLEAVRPPHESLGERAWWLYQLVRQTPLRWWQQHTGTPPEALLQWARKTDWSAALNRGWLEVLQATAAAQQADTSSPALVQQWAHAFLQRGHAAQHDERAADWLGLLPREQREPYWAQALDEFLQKPAFNTSQVYHLSTLFEQMLQAHAPGEEVSPALAQQALAALQKLLGSQEKVALHSLSSEVAQLPCLMPAEALQTLAQLPRQPNDEFPSMAEAQQVAAVRLALRQFPEAGAAAQPPTLPEAKPA